MSAPTAWPAEAALSTLTRVVAPYLGETMARSAVELHRQKLGIDGRHITADQLDALIEKIRTGLAIFVGRDKTELIVREARAAVAALETQG